MAEAETRTPPPTVTTRANIATIAAVANRATEGWAKPFIRSDHHTANGLALRALLRVGVTAALGCGAGIPPRTRARPRAKCSELSGKTGAAVITVSAVSRFAKSSSSATSSNSANYLLEAIAILQSFQHVLE